MHVYFIYISSSVVGQLHHSCICHWYVEAEQRGVSADKERKNYHTARVLLGKKIRRIPILSEDSCCGFLFSHKYICLHWELVGDGLLLQRRLKFKSNLIFNSRFSMALVVIQCLGSGYNFMRLTKSLFLMQNITTVQNSLDCKRKSSKWCRIVLRIEGWRNKNSTCTSSNYYEAQLLT